MTTTNKQKQGFIPIIIILAIVVALGLGYLFTTQKNNLSSIAPTKTVVNPTELPIAKNPDPTADWQTYKNEMVGLEIKYPKDVLLNEEQKGSDKLELGIQIKDMDNYVDETMGFELKTAISDKKSLENENYGILIPGNNYPGARKVIKFDNVFMKTYITLQQIEVCNVQFTRGVVFYKNNYQVVITLGAPITYVSKLSEYFRYDSSNCGDSPIWKSPEKFYLDLTSNKAPQIALDWYNLFEPILSTLRFTDKTVDETVNWKTYTNSKNNFSFKYPETWILKQYAKNVIEDPTTRSRYLVIDEQGSMSNECAEKYESTKVVLSGSTFEKSLYRGVVQGEMCTNSKNLKHREIWLKSSTNPNLGIQYIYDVGAETESLTIINQILSTFKFTQ